jgi:hypothetical protein
VADATAARVKMLRRLENCMAMVVSWMAVLKFLVEG